MQVLKCDSQVQRSSSAASWSEPCCTTGPPESLSSHQPLLLTGLFNHFLPPFAWQSPLTLPLLGFPPLWTACQTSQTQTPPHSLWPSLISSSSSSCWTSLTSSTLLSALSSYCYQSPCRQQDFPRGWKRAVGPVLYCLTSSSRQKKKKKKSQRVCVAPKAGGGGPAHVQETPRHEKTNCAR